jgi:hypothetical protein
MPQINSAWITFLVLTLFDERNQRPSSITNEKINKIPIKQRKYNTQQNNISSY